MTISILSEWVRRNGIINTASAQYSTHEDKEVGVVNLSMKLSGIEQKIGKEEGEIE